MTHVPISGRGQLVLVKGEYRTSLIVEPEDGQLPYTEAGLDLAAWSRVRDTELFYRYTVEDDELYTQPWTGELSLSWHDGPIYEYARHEGNHSMANVLLGGQAEAATRAETGVASN